MLRFVVDHCAGDPSIWTQEPSDQCLVRRQAVPDCAESFSDDLVCLGIGHTTPTGDELNFLLRQSLHLHLLGMLGIELGVPRLSRLTDFHKFSPIGE